ncbi:TetR/AcrR family transcriptional regulator [Microlunatus sp. Y2014]|uniref:TetR/AcrR family transcriptional regulator n=1 Tax=Microlunatus sp. Y2014 TaxID=3418488 RepID=UPI003DA7953D
MSRQSRPQVSLLPLLWAPRERASRTGLSIGSITEAGLQLADADGLDAVTMRAVAAKLGVGAMSLYTHVPGKPELVALMSDAVLARTYEGKGLPAEQSDWQAAVRHVATCNWELSLAHPWRLDLKPGHEVMGPGLVGKYEAELAAVDGIGLSDVDMDLAVALVQSHANSAAAWYLGVRRTEAQRAMTEQEWWESVSAEWGEVGPALGEAMGDATTYPLASRVGEASALAYQGSDPQALFRFGLERILVGIDALRDGPTDHDA